MLAQGTLLKNMMDINYSTVHAVMIYHLNFANTYLCNNELQHQPYSRRLEFAIMATSNV